MQACRGATRPPPDTAAEYDPPSGPGRVGAGCEDIVLSVVIATIGAPMELDQSTWILTGASRGIGEAIAHALWARGARLVLNGRRAQPLEAACRRLSPDPAPTRLRWVAGDVGLAETCGALAAAAGALGGADGVIHNAGVAAPGPTLWELSQDQLDAVLSANLGGALQLVRAIVPTMRRRGHGVLIFVGSGAAERNLAGLGAYCIAKAAEEHLARQLALEAPELSSFVWRPGVVDTRMQAEAREAQGGAADSVRSRFRGLLEDGLLVSPQVAAADLMERLCAAPRALTGRTISLGDP